MVIIVDVEYEKFELEPEDFGIEVDMEKFLDVVDKLNLDDELRPEE